MLIASCAPKEKPFAGVKIGKPYEINGKTYYPAPDSTYDKIGEASWYGPGFDGKRTASGEIFDEDDITAAHPTLPMPSLVKVTNMKNEKQLVVRVNDRGPFHSNRIIDLSKRSAELLGIKGVQPVRVQYLDKESRDYVASIIGKSPMIDMVAYNEEYNKKEDKMQKDLAIQMAKADPSNQIIINNSISGGEVENFAPMQTVLSNDLGEVLSNRSNNTSGNEIQTNSLSLNAKNQENVTISKEVGTEIAPSQEKYIILAGSFSERGNAEKLVNRLKNNKQHQKLVSMDMVNISGRDWWRVYVGPFSSREHAGDNIKLVQDMGVYDARIRTQ